MECPAVSKQSLVFLVVSVVLTAIFFPVLLAVFTSSRAELRRKPIFILNVFAIVLCIILGVLSATIEVQVILQPFKAPRTQQLATTAAFCLVIPLVVEVILLLRLFAVYPIARLTRRMAVLIYGPPILIKVARVLNVAIGIVHLSRTYFNNPDIVQATFHAWQSYVAKVELTLQVLDNGYTSVMFLRRVRLAMFLSARSDPSSNASYKARLRALFWIASSNFVIPVILSLIQLGIIYSHLDPLTASYIPLLFIINGDMEVIGVIMATIWTASRAEEDRGSSERTTGPLRFATNSSRGRYPAVVNVTVHKTVHSDVGKHTNDVDSMEMRSIQKASLQ